ncbi:MAG: helix-turn-helix domain-containing protein [Clostridia bacterium]|nr:helix-turn-helix domain-containing protein [Clostridia bacterium]
MQEFITLLDQAENFRFSSAVQQVWSHKRFSYRTTPRPDHGLMLLIQGRIDFLFDGKRLSAKAGDLVFLPQNAYYEAEFHLEKGRVCDILVNFHADGFKSMKTPALLTQNAPHEWVKSFESLSLAHLERESKFKLNAYLYRLLTQIHEEIIKQKTPVSESVLQTAERLLCSDENTPISQIAKACGLSESGFRKAFTEKFAISPVQYRQRHKIRKASYLMQTSAVSVKEIAYALNFYDESHFCRVFLKWTGKTPKQYLSENSPNAL